MATDDAVVRLADAFQAFCPTHGQLVAPPGYRDSGFALVDAVFSMQDRYDRAHRAVTTYAAWVNRAAAPLPPSGDVDDQHDLLALRAALAGFTPQQAADQVFDNRKKSAAANRLKAELVMEAAERLTSDDVGARSRPDIADSAADRYQAQKRAWTGIHGLGQVTFEYFRLLCGAETSKPDIMVIAWLEGVLDERPDTPRALDLIAALTSELHRRWSEPVLQRAVDHTIWRHQSGRSLDPTTRAI